MKLTLIRNATLRLSYAGRALLLDPYLAEKHSLPAYANLSRNPLVDLPMSAAEVVAGIELTLISHVHTDHFDAAAQERLPKDSLLLCQPANEAAIRSKGFLNVTPVTAAYAWSDIHIQRVPGRHGTSADILQMMGPVSGFVLQAAGEPTVYWVGDSVWYEEVAAAIDQWQPDVIVTHSGGAVWGSQRELIIMDAAQTAAVCQYAPRSTIIATHLEALDHCLTSRAELRRAADNAGISPTQLRIPADGEMVEVKREK
ncbi:MAG: MBL fold metallo-hydrolase [Candidatus Promineifilaceae bacterium]